MKRLALLITALFFSLATFAQNNGVTTETSGDTTRVTIGSKEVTIIEDGDEVIVLTEEDIEEHEAKASLEQGIAEFEAEIAALEAEKQQLEQQMQQANEGQREELEAQIDEKEKAIDALEDGIDELEDELDDIESDCWEHSFDGDFWKDDDFDPHWAGFELGLNNFMNDQMQMELPDNGWFLDLNTSKSWTFKLNLIEYGIPIAGNSAGFVTGLGFDWNNYHFDKNINLIETPEGIIDAEMETAINYQKNSLNTLYLTAPLLFEFQVPGNDSDDALFFSAGLIGGIKLGSKTKQFYEVSDREYKDKHKDDYQLAPFRYGVTARLGYKFVRVFATYYVTPLFEQNKGPEVHPFSIGLTLINF